MPGVPMNIKALYRKISFSEIDLDDQTYSLAPPGSAIPAGMETNSITRQAVVHPPLLIEEGKGHLVVAGRKLINYLSHETESDSCYCLVIPAASEPEEVLALALENILHSRPASAIEQAICWHKAVGCLGESEAKKMFGTRLPLLSRFPGNKLSALADLEDNILAAVHQEHLALKIAFRLIDLERDDRNRLFEIINLLQLSSSNQRKLFDLCLELQRRTEQPIIEVLSGSECHGILNHPEANPPQKTAMLMTWLRESCFPRLSKAETEFRKFVGKLNPPKGVTIAHTTSFENEALSLTVVYKTREELSESWLALKDIFTAKKK